MANPSGPGILYVNSKIISSELSPELFTRWYQDIHIPDIFITSGIKSAFRYFTRASPEIVERPYLALYPLKDVGFLYTDEFKAIPVHSDILPNESRAIFDLADFDTRYYTSIGEVDSSNVREGLCSLKLELRHADMPQKATHILPRVNSICQES